MLHIIVTNTMVGLFPCLQVKLIYHMGCLIFEIDSKLTVYNISKAFILWSWYLTIAGKEYFEITTLNELY